jgi:hypothetical protein
MKSGGGLGAQETDAYVRSMFDMQEERRIAKLAKKDKDKEESSELKTID